MARRLQRHTLRYEGDQAGCIGGLINIFDFRHGRSTRRLLADKRRANMQVVGVEHSNTHRILPHLAEIHENAVDAEQHKMPMADNTKSSVKELMEEEMSNEKGPENQSNCMEIDLEKVDSEHQNTTENNHSDAAKCLMPENCHQVPEVIPSNDLNLEAIMQELAKINLGSYTDCVNDDFHGGLDIPSSQTITVLEEKIAAAVDLFIEQGLSKSKHFREEEESCLSKEFTDALETISLNKGLFLKLLQDRKSPLVKHIKNFEDARLLKDRTCSSFHAYNSSEEKRKHLKSDKFSSRRHLNFFHRRSKSVGSHPLSPETDGDVSTISSQSSHKMENKVQNKRYLSHFSFSEIKRKLRRGISPDRWILKLSPTHQNGKSGEKCTSGENFYSERFANSSSRFKRGEKVNSSKDGGSTMVNQTFQGASNIYIEAKRHLYEMLNDRDEKAEKITRLAPKSLGRVLSLPEYSGSPISSPRKHSDDITITSPMTSSPRGSVENSVNGFLPENHSNHASPSRHKMECQPCKQDDGEQCQNMDVSIPFKGESEYSSEIQSSTENTIIVEVSSSSSSVEVIQETTGFRPQEEGKSTDICSESSKIVTGDPLNEDIKELDNEENASHCLEYSSLCVESNLFKEFQILSSPPLSPTSSPLHREVKDSECAIDRTERPSPVSVLERLFTDDDVSPARTVSQPVEKDIQPRYIHFEEQSSSNSQENCMRISLEDEESEFEYVEAVLLGSGLNWDEFIMRWISSQEILDPFLFDDVEIFSGRPRHDQKLLFDCANEVLEELCESYFGTLHSKQNIRPVLKGMDLIHEVWGQIECSLFQNLMVCSLDQLVKIDVAKSGKWMNLQSDVEVMSYEMEAAIFDELVEDSLLSFMDCTSEYKFEVFQGEFVDIEDTES